MHDNDEQYRDKLSPEAYAVCRQGGTEAPFSGEYYDCKTPGIYRCACCGAALFESTAKYDSGTGWPSFYQPFDDNAIAEYADHSHGMLRTEVRCARCESHLGHVFPDGPQPTGRRYCINSVSLQMDPRDDSKE